MLVGQEMSQTPRTHYATAEGNVHIAYQVIGDGPVNLVFVPPFVSNADVWWEFPPAERFLRRIASVSRLVLMDKRGTGLSDRLTRVDPLEERVDDVRAVMDAVDCKRAIIFSASEASPIAALFAAMYPSRIEGLVMWGSMARWSPAPDYPWAATDQMYTQIIELATEHWGTGFSADFLMPSRAAEADVRQWFSRYEKASSSPGAFAMLTLNNTYSDVRPILPTIHADTIVLHGATDIFVPVEAGRFVASHLPNARYTELPGSDHAFFGFASELLVEQIEAFVAAEHPVDPQQRVLATAMAIDAIAMHPGRERGDEYSDMVAREVERYHGRINRAWGGRVLAVLGGPARAIACARAIRHQAVELGFYVCAAVHTGEFEVIRDSIAGRGVELVTAILDLAEHGEVLATSTARDLVAGAGIHLEDRGVRQLPGILGTVELVALAESPDTSARDQLRHKFEEAVGRAVDAEHPAPQLSPLSRRQSEIAYLVSCGLSNHAIGSRLFISERTVENHIYNILNRLEFESRTQLAAWVARLT